GFQVKVVFCVPTHQYPCNQQIHQQPDDCNQQHAAGSDLRRVHESLYCLVKDEQGYEHQGYTIEYGSQYFKTFIPVCLAVIGNLLSEFESHKCNSKRDCITEHVARIREQCETVRKPSADRFNNHE